MPVTMGDCDVILLGTYDVITSDHEELSAESLRAWSVYVSRVQGWFNNQDKGASSSESVSQESSDSLGYLTTSSSGSSSSSSNSNDTTPVNETGLPLTSYEASKPVRIPGKRGSDTWDDDGGENAVWVRQNATNCPARPSSNSYSPPKARHGWNSHLTSRRHDNDSTGTRLSLPSNINESPPEDSPVWLRRTTAVSDTNVYVTHYIDEPEDDVTPTTDDATYLYTFYQDYVPRDESSYVLINGHEDGVAVDTTAMPTGNKVSDLDARFWRKSGSSRGTSLPTPQPARPKSAEFTLDFTEAKESPYHRRKIRSPSAGERTALGVASRVAIDNPASPSTKSPGLLRRVFGLRRSGSRDKEKNKSTDSLDNVINNNSSFPHKWFRSFHSNSNYQDVNQNCQAESVAPPIAIFSSDEDICSAPATPQHSSCDSSPAVAYTKGPPLLCEPQLEERLSIVLEKQSKRPHEKEADVNDSRASESGKNKSDNGRCNSPKRFFGWRDGLTLRKSSSKRSSSGPELPHLGTASPKKQAPKTDTTADSAKAKAAGSQPNKNLNQDTTERSHIGKPNANRSKSADRAYARNRTDSNRTERDERPSGLPRPNMSGQTSDQRPRSKSSDRETRIQCRSAERTIPQPTKIAHPDQAKCSNPTCSGIQKSLPVARGSKIHDAGPKPHEYGVPCSAPGSSNTSRNTADLKSNSADQILKSNAQKAVTKMRTQSGPLIQRRELAKPRPRSQVTPVKPEADTKPRPKSQVITVNSGIPRTEPSRLKIVKGNKSNQDVDVMSKSMPEKSCLETNSGNRTVYSRTGPSVMSRSMPNKAGMDTSAHQASSGNAFESQSPYVMSQSFPNGKNSLCQNTTDQKHYDSVMSRSVPSENSDRSYDSHVDDANKPESRLKRPERRIPIPVTHISKQEYEATQPERRVIDACPRLERTMYRTARSLDKQRHTQSLVLESRRSQSPQTSDSSQESARPSPPRGGVERLVGETGRPYPPRGIAARYVVGSIGSISSRSSPPRQSVGNKLSESSIRIIPVTRQPTATKNTITADVKPQPKLPEKSEEPPKTKPEEKLKSQTSVQESQVSESENVQKHPAPETLNRDTMSKSLEMPRQPEKENEIPQISQMSVSQDSSTLSQVAETPSSNSQSQSQIPIVSSSQGGKSQRKKRAPYRMMYQRYQTIDLGSMRLQSDFNVSKGRSTSDDSESASVGTANDTKSDTKSDTKDDDSVSQTDRGSDDHLFQSTASLPPRPTHQPRRTASPRRTAGCSPNRMTSPLKIALPRRSSSPYRSASPLAGTPDSPSHSFPTTPHEDYLDRVANARRSWSKRRTGPSQEIDRSGEDARSMDSGIQQDHTPSFESLKTPNEEHIMQVVRRRTPSHSPEKGAKERPKSEVLMVRWSQDVTDNANDVTGRRKKSPKERPKSDLGGGQMVTEALEHYEQKEKYDSPTGLPDFRLKRDAAKMKGRRMSTPQPIKLRLERSPPTKKASHIVRRSHMQRSRSAPDLVDGVKKTKRFAFQVGSAHAGDLAIQMSRFTYEDDDDTSEDAVSWGGASESSSVSSAGKHALLEEIFEEQPVYVEALWHHVTMDPEELGFRAGDVIQVTDMADKDWWWGNLDKREGWFPASFVRLRANQDITVDDLAQKVKDGSWDSHRLLQQYNNGVLSKDQARTNVVNEIMSAEREYVKGLNDVVQGFVEKSRGRPEMFPEDRLALIYCNIEAICKFSEKLLADLEQAFNAEQPEQSQLGHVFLKHKSGFEIYSDYCNNHPQACEELRMLQQHLKYQHFFEGCRVLQKMKEIPLEGFLLTPVQKICKYPLQLAELLKYTKTGHPDYQQLQAALGSMKSIAMMINERKRKLESIEKLEQWQASVQDWEGAELLERSSELIHQGDLTKINSSGWSQERSFFLFDHQLIYCKKLDSLWRYGLIYKGRIDLDNCEITSIDDGKDPQLNVTIRHGWKIQDKSRDKRFLLCASSKEEKEKWLASFKHERKTIEQDEAAGFNLEEYRKKAMKIQNYRISNHPSKDKSGKSKTLQAVYGNSPEALQAFHSPGGTVSRGSDGLLYTPHPRKTKRGILGFIRRTRP